jgi:hypothetical protein
MNELIDFLQGNIASIENENEEIQERIDIGFYTDDKFWYTQMRENRELIRQMRKAIKMFKTLD